MKKPASKVTSIRLSSEEYAQLKSLSDESGVRLSRLIRASLRMALGLPTREEANIRRFGDLASELNRIGVNLNQIAWQANRGALYLAPQDARVLSELQEATAHLKAVFADYQELAKGRSLAPWLAETGS